MMKPTCSSSHVMSALIISALMTMPTETSPRPPAISATGGTLVPILAVAAAQNRFTIVPGTSTRPASIGE